MSMANADMSARGDDQPLFQTLDQRLDCLEDNIGQNRKHIIELITLLSSLDMAAKPTHRNSTSVKYLLRRKLYWIVIGLLVIGWVALTPSGHYWINHFMG
jgi:anaerobic ribonucleoside-triphosphate reductase